MVCMESVCDLNEFSDSICNAFRFEDQPLPAPAPASTEKVTKTFPGAVSNQDLVKNATRALKEFGFGASNTLLTTSFCCDEVNRSLERDFGLHYGDNFSMGGLAGFPFGGVTSFGALAHHIPDDGSCLLIFGPHVGIDSDGNFGSVNRRGRDVPSACCGSACAALKHIESVRTGTGHHIGNDAFADPIDSQQAMVGQILMPYARELSEASDPMLKLPKCLYEAQRRMIDKIVAVACQEVRGGQIAILGGIQINTPDHEPDFFLPLDFEIRTNKNEKVQDLLSTLKITEAID